MAETALRGGCYPSGAHASGNKWHALVTDDVSEMLGTGDRGLDDDEAARRLDRFGPNQLPEAPPTPAWVVFARQFRSPLIYILVAASAVTLLLDEHVDAAVIAFVLLLNALIGFVQERKAETAVRSLMRLVVPRAHVVRSGRELEIDSRELVPGDLVILEPGVRVPADLRLTVTNGLQVDESLLTGESVPVTKQTEPVPEDAPVADRSDMAYMGSVVTSGRGRGVVVATGASTELGAIAELIRSEEAPETPLQQKMGAFARMVGVVVGVASVVVFASGVALGGAVDEMFLTAVALAVAAIPEGLPVAFTITLALGVRRMARRNAIVRRLPAVETLGSTTVIASDKTGTLTENRMTVEKIWAGGRFYRLQTAGGGQPEESAGGRPDEPGVGGWLDDNGPVALEEHDGLRLTLLCGVLTNEAEMRRTDGGIETTGDPTEVALLLAAATAGMDPARLRARHLPVAEIPFEPERRYSAALRSSDGRHVVYVKGAAETVLDMCTRMLVDGSAEPLDRRLVERVAHQMASEGLRVLAMARLELDEPLADPREFREPGGLVFLGLQGMIDPPRPGVPEAVASCRSAGIRVLMVTGDHAGTAAAIARQIGIADESDEVVTGAELDGLGDDELRDRVEKVSVFARVSPEGKLRIVRALQELGHVVAVTGDGVNDAPALKAAAIGVAMGRGGTDVAREAADMVLADDNFVSIAAAVEEGRVTFGNIRKVTFFLVSCAAGTIAAITYGVWAGWPLVMLPAQLLWLNLVTNGLQDVALAFEPGEKDVMRDPPRPLREGVVSRLLWERAALAGLVMAIGTLALFRWELDATGSLERAQTVALTTMVVFMAFHVGNARSDRRSAFRVSPLSNPFLFVATVAALGVHVASLYLPPTQFVLRVEPIEAAAWVRIVAVASTIILAVELHKLVRSPRLGRHTRLRRHTPS
ncbi:MAG: ATPase [Acidimicrobiales bacterium]|nr:MAG: ATPase [Acidimicrobiales bacterium]